MPKPAIRTTSRYAAEAITYLGRFVREARIARKETAEQLAERAGFPGGFCSGSSAATLGARLAPPSRWPRFPVSACSISIASVWRPITRAWRAH